MTGDEIVKLRESSALSAIVMAPIIYSGRIEAGCNV
jgi:hypothetical protein